MPDIHTRESIADAAVALGLPCFPCNTERRPVTPRGFKDATHDPATLRRMFARADAEAIGIPTGKATGQVVVDVDVKHGKPGMAWFDEHRDRLPRTRTHRTQTGGLHLVFRAPAEVEIRNSQDRIAPGIDVRGEGGYVLVPPSPGYVIEDSAEPAEMPAWLVEACQQPKARPEEPPPQPGPRRPGEPHGGTAYGMAALERELDAIRRASFGQQEQTINSAGLKIGGLVAGGELEEGPAFAALVAAARTVPSAPGRQPWSPRELEDKARRAFKDGQSRPRQAPPRAEPLRDKPKAQKAEAPKQQGAKPAASARDLDGFELNEDGVALAFAARFKDELRYCHDTGAWFQWIGGLWRQERTKLAFSWARQVCRDLACEMDADGKLRATLARAATAAAAERFAQSDRAFAVSSEIWDRNPWLLGTPGGTVDLLTGKLRPARQDDYITKTTAVAPAATADCPRWLQFMEEVTGGDVGLIRFLQQWAGYCLTGDTREEALVFAYGQGGNGKGKFLGAVQGILGDYCRTADMATFTAGGDKHPTDLAMLRGARMVSASETEEGHAWSEVRIKQVTGGDVVAARFMRQDFFEYRPQFKLTIIGNHKPVLRNVDDAARRRFNIVPFSFKPDRRDLQLETKLKAEWPGILRWMIEGCLDWQQHGLIRPQAVKEATAEYFEGQDLMAQWLVERCEARATAEAPSSALYRDWSSWAKQQGEEPGTSKAFSAAMERRHAKKRAKTGVVFLGLRLKPSDTGIW